MSILEQNQDQTITIHIQLHECMLLIYMYQTQIELHSTASL